MSEELQVADKLVILPDHWQDGKVVDVERVTKTQAILSDGKKVRRPKRNWYAAIGVAHSRLDYCDWTQERQDRIDKAHLVSKFKALKWEKLSLDVMKKIDLVIYKECNDD